MVNDPPMPGDIYMNNLKWNLNSNNLNKKSNTAYFNIDFGSGKILRPSTNVVNCDHMMLNNVNDHTMLLVDGQKTYIDHKIFECSTSVSWKST